MIRDRELVFVEQAPNLDDPELHSRLHDSTRVGRWIRWTILVLCLPLVTLITWGGVAPRLPPVIFETLGIHAPKGHYTTTGFIIVGIFFLMGLAGIRFSWRLFRDESVDSPRAQQSIRSDRTEFTWTQRLARFDRGDLRTRYTRRDLG